MTRKMIDQGPDLFAWADARPKADVVDFLARRETMARYILCSMDSTDRSLMSLDKLIGLKPPTPILPLKREA